MGNKGSRHRVFHNYTTYSSDEEDSDSSDSSSNEFEESDSEEQHKGLLRQNKQTRKRRTKIFKFSVKDSENGFGTMEHVSAKENLQLIPEYESDIDEDEVEVELLSPDKHHGKDSISLAPSRQIPRNTARFFNMVPESISEVERFVGHNGHVPTILYFYEHGKIVSHSQNIRIWDLKTGEHEHVRIKLGVEHMIKWSENEFICGGGSSSLQCYDLRESRFTKTYVENDESIGMIRLLRITNRYFCTINKKGVLSLFATELTSKPVSRFIEATGKKSPSSFDVRMVRSKSYPKCIFLNGIDDDIEPPNNSRVRLLDLSTRDVLIELSNNPRISAIDSILTKSGKEVLLIATLEFGVYMIDTISGKVRFLRNKKSVGHPTSLFTYFNRYIFVGSSRGQLNLYDIQKNYVERKIHEGRINEILFCSYEERKVEDSEEEDSLRLFTSSNDGIVKMIVVSICKKEDLERIRIEKKKKKGNEENEDDSNSMMQRNEAIVRKLLFEKNKQIKGIKRKSEKEEEKVGINEEEESESESDSDNVSSEEEEEESSSSEEAEDEESSSSEESESDSD